MSGTTVVTSGGEENPAEIPAEIAKDIGKVEERTEHHAEKIEEHAEKIEENEQWRTYAEQQFNSLWTAAHGAAESARAAMGEEIASLRSTVDSLTEKLSSTVQPSGETTKPPEPEPNKAAKKEVTGPFAGVRRWLHRLL